MISRVCGICSGYKLNLGEQNENQGKIREILGKMTSLIWADILVGHVFNLIG